MAPPPDSCLENPMDRGAWGAIVWGGVGGAGHTELDTTERLSTWTPPFKGGHPHLCAHCGKQGLCSCN